MLLNVHISFNTLQRSQLGVESDWVNDAIAVINNTFPTPVGCENFTATAGQPTCGDSVTVGGGLGDLNFLRHSPLFVLFI